MEEISVRFGMRLCPLYALAGAVPIGQTPMVTLACSRAKKAALVAVPTSSATRFKHDLLFKRPQHRHAVVAAR
jgi:hypothetical protein